jgi:hypothetical protein
MGSKPLLAAALSLVFFAAAPSPDVWGLSDGSTLSGAVLDNCGAIIVNAKVSVCNVIISSEKDITTNESANFTLLNVPLGNRTVRWRLLHSPQTYKGFAGPTGTATWFEAAA